MNRRTFLRASAAASALGLAGCSGGAPGTEETTATTTEGDDSTTEASTTDTSTTATTRATTVVDTSFERLDGGCGQQVDAATVTFGDGVRVEGTIWGSDTCQRARLASADVDPASGRLTVAVETYTHTEDGETTACGQCIVELDYRATVTVDGPLPDEVVVTHRGEPVTTASPDA